MLFFLFFFLDFNKNILIFQFGTTTAIHSLIHNARLRKFNVNPFVISQIKIIFLLFFIFLKINLFLKISEACELLPLLLPFHDPTLNDTEINSDLLFNVFGEIHYYLEIEVLNINII